MSVILCTGKPPSIRCSTTPTPEDGEDEDDELTDGGARSWL